MARTPIRYLRRSLFGLAVLALAFWWYEYRPYAARRQCARSVASVESTGVYYDLRNAAFEECLHLHGLLR